MSDSEDPVDPSEVEEDGDDLFGDDPDAPAASPKARVLDDDELASDPDEDTRERYRTGYDDDDEGQTAPETRDRVVMAVQTYRHRIPKPRDDALRVMRVPKFVQFLPEMYNPGTFVPSDFDVQNARAAQPKHVTRVSKDADTDELKSNTNVFRWSDGSVTVSIGGEQYEVQKKGLAPQPGQKYEAVQDGHYYAAAAELKSNLLVTVGHVIEQWNVRPNKTAGDDALDRLAERMAQAAGGRRDNELFIRTTRDPELQKKEAEMAEKERLKAQRRRENAAAKMGGGLGRSGRGALSIGDLEGGRRMPSSGRKRGVPGAGKPKRRKPEYDSDDDLPQGVGRHEDYDLDDGFLVGSDDEEAESLEEDDDDDDDLLDDEPAPRSKRQRTQEPEADEDASGDDVEPSAEASARARRRNIVDDDDDDE